MCEEKRRKIFLMKAGNAVNSGAMDKFPNKKQINFTLFNLCNRFCKAFFFNWGIAKRVNSSEIITVKKHTHKSNCFIFILIAAIAIPAFGQFRSDIPLTNIRESIAGKTEFASLFDPNRYQMNHSFSMSFLSMNGAPVSVGAYTNSFSFAISPNMILNTQVSLVQPSMGGINNQGQLFYNVGLDYKVSENSLFSFKINNYPTYYQRSNQYYHLRGY